MIIRFGLVIFLSLQLTLLEGVLTPHCHTFHPTTNLDKKELYSSFIEAINIDKHNPCDDFYKYACDCFDETYKDDQFTDRYAKLKNQVKNQLKDLVMNPSLSVSSTNGAIQKMVEFREACLKHYGNDPETCFTDINNIFQVVVDFMYTAKYWLPKADAIKPRVEEMIENIKEGFGKILKNNEDWLVSDKTLISTGLKFWKGQDPVTKKEVQDTPYEHAKRKLSHLKYAVGYPYIMDRTNVDTLHAHFVIDTKLTYEALIKALKRQRDDIALKIPIGGTIDGFDHPLSGTYVGHFLKPSSRATVVNAHYETDINMIFVHPAILQKPFYDINYPDAVNYGRIGSIIGHEITHGFDSDGCLYDVNGKTTSRPYQILNADGSVRETAAGSPWMDDKTRERFVRRVDKVGEHYKDPNSLPPHFYDPRRGIDMKVKLKPEHTSAEDIADQGGVRAAYFAFKNLKKDANDRKAIPDDFLHGFNINESDFKRKLDKLFFTSYATLYCDSRSHRQNINAFIQHVTGPDNHSHKYARVNVVLGNNNEFISLYGCSTSGDHRMVPRNPFTLWA